MQISARNNRFEDSALNLHTPGVFFAIEDKVGDHFFGKEVWLPRRSSKAAANTKSSDRESGTVTVIVTEEGLEYDPLFTDPASYIQLPGFIHLLGSGPSVGRPSTIKGNLFKNSSINIGFADEPQIENNLFVGTGNDTSDRLFSRKGSIVVWQWSENIKLPNIKKNTFFGVSGPAITVLKEKDREGEPIYSQPFDFSGNFWMNQDGKMQEDDIINMVSCDYEIPNFILFPALEAPDPETPIE